MRAENSQNHFLREIQNSKLKSVLSAHLNPHQMIRKLIEIILFNRLIFELPKVQSNEIHEIGTKLELNTTGTVH